MNNVRVKENVNVITYLDETMRNIRGEEKAHITTYSKGTLKDRGEDWNKKKKNKKPLLGFLHYEKHTNGISSALIQ